MAGVGSGIAGVAAEIGDSMPSFSFGDGDGDGGGWSWDGGGGDDGGGGGCEGGGDEGGGGGCGGEAIEYSCMNKFVILQNLFLLLQELSIRFRLASTAEMISFGHERYSRPIHTTACPNPP